MSQIKQIKTYIQRDFDLEWKNKSVISSSIIYLISIVFICRHAFEFIDPDVWNALFWIVMLFSALTIVGRSFDAEREPYFLYHYHLVPPSVIIASKLVLNAFYCILLGGIAYLSFSIFLGNQIQSFITMFCILILGSISLGFTFTLASAISSRINGNLVLTSILSLPILLPVLILLVQLTNRAFGSYTFVQNATLLFALCVLNVMIFIISYILFPYLWRD